jgi:FKBP-type peptidyl-prolyl cis-trans isomerase 2
VNGDAIQSVPKTSFADDIILEVGNVVQGQAPNGMPIHAKIASVGDEQVTLDFNHPLAGQDLTFDIELLGVDSE